MRGFGWALATTMLLIGCGSSDASNDSPNSPIITSPVATTDASSDQEPVSSATIPQVVESESDSTIANNDTSPTASNATTVVAVSGAPSTAPATIATTTFVVPTTVPPPADPVGLRIEAEHSTGYDRDLFRHWIDADGDGCDTRKEVLIAESLEPVQTGSNCAILSGRWYSIYDNTETTDSSRFDIDHVVALKEAWDSGAWNWTADQRKNFANDLSESYFLIAVSASSNRSKSDRDPAEWLPTNTGYRCDYVRIWIDVKRAWNLSVDPAEDAALRNVLANC